MAGKYFKIIILFSLIACLPGCAGTQSSLLERRSKKIIAPKESMEEIVAKKLVLTPSGATVTKDEIEITAEYASQEDLDELFLNKAIFGKKAKVNPYFPDLIVFHVTIVNRSGGRIRLNPDAFVILDGLSGQYAYLPPEYIIDLFASRSTSYSMAKTTEDTAPGLYGMPFRMTAGTYARGKRRTRLGLLKRVSLTPGYIYNDVIYDGYAAFLRPSLQSSNLTLILADIETEFDSAGEAIKNVTFEFRFEMDYL